MSTYQQSYSKSGPKDLHATNLQMRELRNRPSGITTAKEDLQGIKMTSVLTGEQYRDFEDPQQNTHIQRSWVYGGERTLDVADDNLRRTLDQMGGSGTTDMIMSQYKRSGLPQFRIGDGTTSVPLESEILVY